MLNKSEKETLRVIEEVTKESSCEEFSLNSFEKTWILKNPEDSYEISGLYDLEKGLESVVRVKAEHYGDSPSLLYAKICLNYNGLLDYLDKIIKKELGTEGSRDKARFVLDKVLERHLGRKCHLQASGGRIDYKDPFIRTLGLWNKLISTCPIIDPKRVYDHQDALGKLRRNFRVHRASQALFRGNLVDWVKSQDSLLNEVLSINSKEYSVLHLVCDHSGNGLLWFIKERPDLVKIFRKKIWRYIL